MKTRLDCIVNKLGNSCKFVYIYTNRVILSYCVYIFSRHSKTLINSNSIECSCCPSGYESTYEKTGCEPCHIKEYSAGNCTICKTCIPLGTCKFPRFYACYFFIKPTHTSVRLRRHDLTEKYIYNKYAVLKVKSLLV